MTCTLCPRLCAAERTPARGDGYCRMPAGLRVARAALHQWEEPPISGTRGAGAVFFSGCTLRCCYCQNGRISAGGQGKDITPRRLREIFDELIAQGAHNIELVTATHFLPWILPALEPRLPVPVVYNCGGYERVETLRGLEGKIDIYLPDLKYADAGLSGSLSGAADYFTVTREAIREMVRQTGMPQWRGEKMVRGTIIRHLILPGQVENSLRVLDWIGENFAPGQVLVSLMRQYTPMGGLAAPFDRRVRSDEYEAVLSWMYLNRLEGFTQEETAADAGFIPDFRQER